MSERIKNMARALVYPRGMQAIPRKYIGYPIHFHKGNRHAAKENFSEDSHQRRIMGLLKTWGIIERIRRGEKVMTLAKMKARKQRKRVKLRESIELEARQLQSKARMAATEIMDMLTEVVKNKSKTERTSDRIAAANVLLDRAYGKANATHTNVNVNANAAVEEASTNELIARAKELVKEAGAEVNPVRARKKKESKDGPPDIRERDGNTGGSTLH